MERVLDSLVCTVVPKVVATRPIWTHLAVKVEVVTKPTPQIPYVQETARRSTQQIVSAVVLEHVTRLVVQTLNVPHITVPETVYKAWLLRQSVKCVCLGSTEQTAQ